MKYILKITIMVLLLTAALTIPVHAAGPQNMLTATSKTPKNMHNPFCMFTVAWNFFNAGIGATFSKGVVSVKLDQTTATKIIQNLGMNESRYVSAYESGLIEYDLTLIEADVLYQFADATSEKTLGTLMLKINLIKNFGSEPCDDNDDPPGWPPSGPQTETPWVHESFFSQNIALWISLLSLVLIFVVGIPATLILHTGKGKQDQEYA